MADQDNSEQPRKRVRLTSPENDTAENINGARETDTPMTMADMAKGQLEQERKIGVTAFAAKDEGFTCIVKHR